MHYLIYLLRFWSLKAYMGVEDMKHMEVSLQDSTWWIILLGFTQPSVSNSRNRTWKYVSKYFAFHFVEFSAFRLEKRFYFAT